MGYRTYHTVTADPEMTDAQREELTEIAGLPIECIDGAEDAKWYHEEEDMLAFSENYPNQVFRVEGVGEEQGDIWVHWYKNGKVQKWNLDYDMPGEPPEAW